MWATLIGFGRSQNAGLEAVSRLGRFGLKKKKPENLRLSLAPRGFEPLSSG